MVGGGQLGCLCLGCWLWLVSSTPACFSTGQLEDKGKLRSLLGTGSPVPPQRHSRGLRVLTMIALLAAGDSTPLGLASIAFEIVAAN